MKKTSVSKLEFPPIDYEKLSDEQKREFDSLASKLEEHKRTYPETPMKKIQDLKKGDKFKFNHMIYQVKRKWINDDKPLIAICIDQWGEQRFHWEGLEVETLEFEK